MVEFSRISALGPVSGYMGCFVNPDLRHDHNITALQDDVLFQILAFLNL
jgi:hypothetical protein